MAPELDKSHLLPFELWYEDFAPGYPTIRISNDHASATIALHGAHLIDYIPRDQEPVIFTSREAIFKEGKAIRGGIPVCWPWFGAHPSDSSMPAHGFARNRFWQLVSSKSSPEGTEVVLELDTDSIDLWQHSTKLTLTIFVGKELQLDLTTTNLGDTEVTIGGALHSYFIVGSIEQTTLSGLDQTSFLDTLSNTTETQIGDIHFNSETDSIYKQTEAAVTIHDPLLKRNIHISKSGSTSTVVWNPWINKAAALADLADDEYHDFLCIEAANAHEDVYTLQANQSHTLSTSISSIPNH
jgi:D-hexose-6-phosphate mutarotase